MAALPQNVVLQEETLIRRACSGDRKAFCSLVRPHERAVYLAALSATDSEADAEELAQETVMEAFVSLWEFRGDRPFRNWLIEVASAEARLHLENRRRSASATLDPSSLNGEEQYLPRHMDEWHWIPLQALGKKEVRDVIARALASLPVKHRQVLVLRDVQKLSADDTAKILGIGEEDVKKRLQSARLQMRDALAASVYPEWVRAASGKVG